jgi:hypothetical protein
LLASDSRDEYLKIVKAVLDRRRLQKKTKLSYDDSEQE